MKLMCISADIRDNCFTAGEIYDLEEHLSWGGFDVIDDEGDLHEFELDNKNRFVPCGNSDANSDAKFERLHIVEKPIPKNITILHNQQRIDEVTEWCRNKPEEAAVRILTLEAEEEKPQQ